MHAPGWIDPLKLLVLAEALVDHHEGPGRPRHTDLRRAVSTGYYAVYHKLCLVAAQTLLPDAPVATWLRLLRAHVDDARRCVERIDALTDRDRHALATLLAMRATARR